MIKKSITFENVDGNEVTEVHYFHLSVPDMAAMEVSEEGGLGELIKKLVKEKRMAKVLEVFEELLRRSYGFRDDDGKFDKDPDLTAKFMRSMAYGALFEELVTDEKLAAEFLIGILPSKMSKNQDVVRAVNDAILSEDGEENASEELPWAHREPTPRELSTMTREQMLDVFKRKSSQG